MRLSLLLAGLAVALSACGDPEAPAALGARPGDSAKAPRVLVVGWDGASFRWTDALMAEGRLPNLARLQARGVRAPLDSTRIPISASAWTSAFTGVETGRTGVFSFFEPRPDSYDLTLVSSLSNHAIPIWRRLTARGLSSVVFGVPLTYPPEPLLGTMVCGMLTPPDATFTWPPELSTTLRARGYDPDIEPWWDDEHTEGEELLAQLRLRGTLLRERLEQDDWSLAWAVFKEVDATSHYAYGKDYLTTVAPLYDTLDEVLGQLLDAVDLERTSVLVVSDHGFGIYAHGLNLHEILIAEGLSARREGSVVEPLPVGPLASVRPAESVQRLRELDLARTRAFAWTCEGNFGSVRLNRVGREPQGIVTEDEVEATLQACEERLRAHPWVVRTYRASELLPGPQRAALPDLLVETRPDVQLFSEHGAPLSGTYPYPLADHDVTGIFVAAGRGFVAGERSETALALVDIAPTILHLLGLPVPADLNGRVPESCLDVGPVRREPAIAPQALPRLGPSEVPYTLEALEALERKLSKLGYAR